MKRTATTFRYAATLLSFAGWAIAAPAADTMTNAAVITLVKAGLSEGLIIDKINVESCGYNVSTNDMITLRQSGVSDNIIGAMVRRCASLPSVRGVAGNDTSNDPMTRHSPGIYVAANWLAAKPLQVLRPSKSSGVRTTGNGSVMLPLVAHMVVPGTTGHVIILGSSPVFYFYFNLSDIRVDGFGTEGPSAAQSPDEFSLVRFKQKDNSREIDLGKASSYGGSLVSLRRGMNSKYNVNFTTEDLGSGIYRVTLDKPMDPGEYAFVLTSNGSPTRIYDFSISGTTSPQTALNK